VDDPGIFLEVIDGQLVILAIDDRIKADRQRRRDEDDDKDDS
jgi:hypothetical protein